MNNSTALLPTEDSGSDTGDASTFHPYLRPASWRPATPLPPRTLTISEEGTSTLPMEKPSIGNGTGARYHWLDRYAAVVLILFALAVWAGSALIAQVTFHHMDDMRHIGWAAQEVQVNGKPGKVYVPIFLTKETFDQNGGHP